MDGKHTLRTMDNCNQDTIYRQKTSHTRQAVPRWSKCCPTEWGIAKSPAYSTQLVPCVLLGGTGLHTSVKQNVGAFISCCLHDMAVWNGMDTAIVTSCPGVGLLVLHVTRVVAAVSSLAVVKYDWEERRNAEPKRQQSITHDINHLCLSCNQNSTRQRGQDKEALFKFVFFLKSIVNGVLIIVFEGQHACA